MGLYVVHVRIEDEGLVSEDRIVGPFRSEDVAVGVSELVRGRTYTRFVKNKGLIGRTGVYPDLCVKAEVKELHSGAAKYHYDWAEEQLLATIQTKKGNR